MAHAGFTGEQEDVGGVDALVFEEVIELFGVIAFDQKGFLFAQTASCEDLAEAGAGAFFEEQEVDAFEGTAFLHFAQLGELGFPFEAIGEREGALPVIAVVAMADGAKVKLWAAVDVVGPPEGFGEMPVEQALGLGLGLPSQL